jgi:hypothetical protein
VAGDSGPGGVTDAPAQKDASKRARGPVAVAGFAPHKHPDYPDGPDLDPMLGARTPAFVAWLKQGTRTNF